MKHRLKATIWAVVLVLAAASCGSDTQTPDADADAGSGAGSEPPGFIVAGGGQDAVAVIHDRQVEPVEGMVGQFRADGALAVPVGTGAVVLGRTRIAKVGSDGPPIVRDCVDCAGLAATERVVVTTRKNRQPGEGFDMVFLSHGLEVERVVPTRRLSERRTVGFPAENTASPLTLAASADRVTVGYLSENGGVRAGPTVVAQYSYDGELLDSVLVDHIVGQAEVSPDGRFVALGVGGSSGACITVRRLAVLALDGLDLLDVGPAAPVEVSAQVEGLSQPWFTMTDLQWEGTTVRATGEVHNPPAGDHCDTQPELWTRRFDTGTGDYADDRSGDVRALRWIGPGCDDVVAVVGTFGDSTVVERVGGKESPLGRYERLALGRPPPADC